MLTESILGDVLGLAGQQYSTVHFTVLCSRVQGGSPAPV